MAYCSRSVLTKTQLYLWIRQNTGRKWLVDVGDANKLEYLTPRSLSQGYADVEVTEKAPRCLTGSVSTRSMESFENIMASCSFTSSSEHTGNVARPWEYSESFNSIIALDFETVGYDLVQGSIGYGEYFDKACLCDTYAMDAHREPCQGADLLDLTKERLWMYATCGPTYLPRNWADSLKTTGFAYIPTEQWRWPKCVADMPSQVTRLTDTCATNACERDARGYCRVKRTVDRACVCRGINYDSCGGSCQFFDTRMDYVKWLHDLCGEVQDWNGLPVDWRHLAAPTSHDLVPWQWTVTSTSPSNTTFPTLPDRNNVTQTCPSNDWKLGSIVLINIATALAVFFGRRSGVQHSTNWALKGISIAILQILANWFNAMLVQTTLGFEDVPIIQLMLLWCTLPRLTWLPTAIVGVQPFKAVNFSAAASSLLAEIVLQVVAFYYMLTTMGYGLEHNLYFGGMKGVVRETPATLMYYGAAVWLLTHAAAFVLLVLCIPGMDVPTESYRSDLPSSHRTQHTSSTIVEEAVAQFDEHSSLIGKNVASQWTNKNKNSSSTGVTGDKWAAYGTFANKAHNEIYISPKALVRPYLVIVAIMFVLWIAQWMFWAGFIRLSTEEYVLKHLLNTYKLIIYRFCPPNFGVLTAVWMAASVAGVVIGAS
jgi:hypothetical protein